MTQFRSLIAPFSLLPIFLGVVACGAAPDTTTPEPVDGVNPGKEPYPSDDSTEIFRVEELPQTSGFTPYVQNVAIIAGDSPGIQCPALYGKINKDLNEGARGKFIYFCYGKDSAIADEFGRGLINYMSAFATSASQGDGARFDTTCFDRDPISGQCRENYVNAISPSNGDLNQGTSRHEMYVYATKSFTNETCDASSCSYAPWFDGKVVTEMAVISGSSSGIQCPSGYGKVPMDLNRGARGKYIFLCTKREGYCGNHSLCEVGPPLRNNCVDSCVNDICAADPYCCTTAWDSQCVSEVNSICGQSCP